ncbi:hypothetical protein BGZ60DRAFT_522369 [Tricladium varicosporioides]|nr:hypothetical protein BGZ60DRAFT_522369 [Hymenoscyphus varicosporioides]
MPIRLGDESSAPRWNDWVLVLFWIVQFATAAFFEAWLFLYIALLGAFGSGGTSFLSMPIFLGTFCVLGLILYEARQLKTDELTITSFYRYQVMKSAFFGFILMMVFVPVIKQSSVIGTMMWSCTFVAPFWGALWYAVRLRSDAGGFEDEGLGRFW